MEYRLYLETDLNRVFTGSLGPLAATELRLVADTLIPNRIGPIEVTTQSRATMLRFPVSGQSASELNSDLNSDLNSQVTDQLTGVLGQLAASSALFAAAGDGLIRPVELEQQLHYETDLVTTQRYRGKTNERLTRAMLNLALATAGFPLSFDAEATSRPVVLDPMCGRGTTLNWALAYGLDALGIEIDGGALDEHARFIQTWAKRARLPHKASTHRRGNAEDRHTTLRVATSRTAFKAGHSQRVETFTADGTARVASIGRRSIDAIVTDLPYGIHHRGGRGGAGSPPRPDDDTIALLRRALPTWHRWLRPGGGLCFAWNTRRADRTEVAATVADAGFDLVEPPPGFSMAHTVDATIERDVLVAVQRQRAPNTDSAPTPQ